MYTDQARWSDGQARRGQGGSKVVAGLCQGHGSLGARPGSLWSRVIATMWYQSLLEVGFRKHKRCVNKCQRVAQRKPPSGLWVL